MGGFARDAPKAQNGFIFVRNVSSPPRRRNILLKIPVISGGPPRLEAAWRVASTAVSMLRARHRHARASHASHAFYVCLLKRSPNEAWALSNRGRSRCDPSHRNREARTTTGRIHVRDAHHDGAKARNVARRGPWRSTSEPHCAWRNGTAIATRLRGRAADVRAADRLASCETARRPRHRH